MKFYYLYSLLLMNSFLFSEDVVNQWQKIEVDLKAIENLPEGKGVTFEATDGYSDSEYDSVTNEVLIRTNISVPDKNVKPGFYTNCTLAYSPKTQKLRLIEYSAWSGGSYQLGSVPENFSENLSPTPRHTYDGMTVVPGNHSLYMMLGANIRMSRGSGKKMDEVSQKYYDEDNKGLWRLDLKTGKWELIPNNIRQFWPSIYKVSPYESHMHYWEKENKIIFINTKCAMYDLKEQKWEEVERPKNGSSPIQLYGARSVWDTKRDLWVFRYGNKLCQLDPSTLIFKLLPEPYAEDLHKEIDKDKKKRSLDLKSICYLPREDGYLITGLTGKETFFYDIEKGVWHQLDCGEVKIPRGYLNYDVATDKIIINYHYHISELKLDLTKVLAASIEGKEKSKVD